MFASLQFFGGGGVIMHFNLSGVRTKTPVTWMTKHSPKPVIVVDKLDKDVM